MAQGTQKGKGDEQILRECWGSRGYCIVVQKQEKEGACGGREILDADQKSFFKTKI